MPRVTFLPAGVTVEATDDETLFEIGRRGGIAIETACVGKASCGLCRVKVIAGADALSRYNEAEERHLGNVYFITRIRLSCQARVAGDVTVELAPRKPRTR